MSDQKSREKIINEIETNFFVEAGAGSGKTTILVERMVGMVEKGLPVERICTITFTKAAANEFYERFQKRLIERSRIPENYEEVGYRLPKPTKETVLLCQKALENIDLCFMGTIDSFCNMILSEHPTEANVPNDARLIDDDTAKAIYKQFYIKVRRGDYNKELAKISETFSRMYYSAEDTFAVLMKEIMDRRNVHFNEVKVSDKNDIYSAFHKERDDLIKVLNKFSEDTSKIILPLKEGDDRSTEEALRDYKTTVYRDWKFNYIGVMNALKALAKMEYEASPDELGFTDESVVRERDGKTILNVMDEDNPRALYYLMMNYKHQITMKLLLGCVGFLEKEMRESGQFTFFDYLFYLREMLKRDAENDGKLIDYIYNRHSFFMIDEFQDTNPMQAEIFFYLSSKEPVGDWTKCKPRPGSLFIVGDPKQSIYRFRAADISSYLKVKSLFEKGVGEVLYLSNNFRSRNVMKTYFNDVFSKMMPEETEDQSAYKDIENTDSSEKEEFEGIYTYESYSDSLLVDYPDMSDDLRLAKIIETMVDNDNVRIYDKDSDGSTRLRTLEYKDFMIIFSAKKNIGSCISTFKQQGIPVRVEGKVLFEECEGLKAITSIYKTVTNIKDQIALVSALYSPVFGLNENDLAAYRKAGKRIIIRIDEEYGDVPVESALKKLKDTSLAIVSQTPSSLFEKIMDDYEIFRYVSSENLEIVYYTLELLRNEERTGNIINYEDAVAYLEDLLNEKSGLERCLSLKQNLNSVHVANLHKVKGLEAPVVILAKAGAKNRIEPELRIEYKNDSTEGYIIGIKDRDSDYEQKYPFFETNKFKEQNDKEIESQRKENERLVYVAATRARNALIINLPKQKGRGDKIQNGTSNKWSKLKELASADIFDAVGEKNNSEKKEITQVNSESLYSKYEPMKIEKTNTYSLQSPSTLTSSSKYEETFETKEGIVEDGGETYSTLIGTMVHRLLEMIIMSKDRSAKQDLVNNILSEYLIVEMEEYRETFRKKLDSVYDVMHNGGFPQINGAIQNILPEVLDAEEVYSEIPFTYKEEKTIWNGIIDLIYRKDGKLHIIDWKTNRNDEGLAEHYKEQLDAYKKATSQITGEEAEDALIYHINIV